MKVIDEKDFPMLVDIYNREGNKAVNKYIRDTYGVKYPWAVMQRIRNTPGYDYDTVNKKFKTALDHTEETIFMSIDDLCKNNKDGKSSDNRSKSPISMDALIHNLISDRLLELSRYVTLEASNRTILIDKTSMASDGYKVYIH